MAIIKAVSSRAEIGAVIDYVSKVEKTELRLMSGILCDPTTAKEEMRATKLLWGKEGGRTYKHFVQSFAPDENITPDQAHHIACQFAAARPEWEGFEVLIATHQDREHIHTHFVVNSVSTVDGHKLQQSKADLENMKAKSDEICQRYGLHLTEQGKTFDGEQREETVAWSKDTYQILKGAEQGGAKSYVLNIALAVLDCKEIAISREHFKELMLDRGYGVEWQDSHKYVTFIDLERQCRGEKVCKVRNNKLEKYYNMDFGKDGMESEFERNARAAIGADPTGAATRNEQAEPDRVREPLAEGSVGAVERAMRGIDESVYRRTSQGRAEQARRCREEQAAHQENEGNRGRPTGQQQYFEYRYIEPY